MRNTNEILIFPFIYRTLLTTKINCLRWGTLGLGLDGIGNFDNLGNLLGFFAGGGFKDGSGMDWVHRRYDTGQGAGDWDILFDDIYIYGSFIISID